MFCSCSRYKLRASYNMNNKITMLTDALVQGKCFCADLLVTLVCSNFVPHNFIQQVIHPLWLAVDLSPLQMNHYSKFISIHGKIMTKVNFYLLSEEEKKKSNNKNRSVGWFQANEKRKWGLHNEADCSTLNAHSRFPSSLHMKQKKKLKWSPWIRFWLLFELARRKAKRWLHCAHANTIYMLH